MVKVPSLVVILAFVLVIAFGIITLTASIRADERREDALEQGREQAAAELEEGLEDRLRAAEAAGFDRGRLTSRAELADSLGSVWAGPEPGSRLDPAGYARGLSRVLSGTTGTLPACDGSARCQCPDHRPDLSAPYSVIETMITGEPWAGPEPGSRLAGWAPGEVAPIRDSRHPDFWSPANLAALKGLPEPVDWLADHLLSLAEHYDLMLELEDETAMMVETWPTLESVRADRELAGSPS